MDRTSGLIWPSAVRPRRAQRAPPSIRSVASEASPTVRRPTGGERSELRRATGHDFVRWILSYALGFVWVSFPRASSLGFSFSWLTARAELRSSRVNVASGIAVAASIATLNPNLNLPALPPEVRRPIAARRFRPSSMAKKATDGTVGVRARCVVYSVWIAHPGSKKIQFF